MDKQQILHELTMRILPQTLLHNQTEILVREYIEIYAKVETAYDQITADKEARKPRAQFE